MRVSQKDVNRPRHNYAHYFISVVVRSFSSIIKESTSTDAHSRQQTGVGHRDCYKITAEMPYARESSFRRSFNEDRKSNLVVASQMALSVHS